LEQALHPQLLKEYGITHIVNVTLSGNVFEKGLQVALENIRMGDKSINDLQQGFVIPQYQRIPIADRIDTDISLHFNNVFQFLDDALKNPNNKILVHCQAGISRSSTLVIAYLMYSRNWTIDQAYLHVKSKRKRIHPNKGFARQLLQYHFSLHGDITNGCKQWLQLYHFDTKTDTKKRS
jgi:protein-tyrosine phosphatase